MRKSCKWEEKWKEKSVRLYGNCPNIKNQSNLLIKIY